MGMLQSSSIIASSSVMAFLRSITARMMASALVMNGVKMPRLSSRRMIFLIRRSTRSQHSEATPGSFAFTFDSAGLVRQRSKSLASAALFQH